MVLDLNTYPYYDDFDPTKEYYKILFRPGYAVQARELTQIQSIIQNQVKNLGDSIYKDGSMVIPGESGLDLSYAFVTLQTDYNSNPINVSNFLNQKIVGATSGAIATVQEVVAASGGDPNTLYLKYEVGSNSKTYTAAIANGNTTITGFSADATKVLAVGSLIAGTGIPANTFVTTIISSTSFTVNNAPTATNGAVTLTVGSSSVFSNNETITTVVSSGQSYNATTSTSAATGFGCRAQVNEGVYYTAGYFCLVEQQSLILDKYTNTPSYRIGIVIADAFVTSDEDVSLVDPAQGAPNFNAPGADRYQIVLTLSKYALTDTVSNNFIELIRVNNGVVQSQVTNDTYSQLAKTLAQRTYDEAGDYTVTPFNLQIRENLNNGSNNGVYTASNGGDDTQLVYALDAGKAYVKGYQIQSVATTMIDAPKARTTLTQNEYTTFQDLGSYVEVNHLVGTFNITTYDAVNLVNSSSSTIGTAKVRGLTLVNGTPGTVSAEYRLHLFDVVMDTDSSGTIPFANVRTIVATGKSATTILDTNNNATLNDVANNVAIISIPEYAIQTLKDTYGNVDTTYTVRRYLSGTMTGNTLTLSANANELFNAFDELAYHVSITSPSSTATGNGFTTGSIINLTASGNSVVLGGSPTGSQVTITIPTISGSSIAVIATITKSLVVQKTKSLATNSETLAHANTLQLGKADIYSLTSVIDVSSGANITSRYTLDNGQRDNYYDRGNLTFDTDYASPSGNVTVTYEYFNHGSGDYFSVDSYSGVIDYDDIPFYSSTVTGTNYDLINCLDFRPRVNDAGNGYSVTSEIVADTKELQCNFTYYVGRMDKIILTPKGEFKVIQGSSGVNPQPPADPVDAMVLYNVTIPPYTFSAANVTYTMVDNRRYTMRDIGSLATRITNLEYYTSLSLLEQNTSNLFIDDGTGNNAFKNGFIVDNFSSFSVANGALPENQCSMDTTNGILRPTFDTENVDVTLDTVNSTNYQQTGLLVTLPYTTEALITQPFGSDTENVNPYNVFNWIGTVTLTPASDDWYDTDQLPDIVITNDDSYNNAMATVNGSVTWNNWVTNWVGTPTTTSSTQVGFVSSSEYEQLAYAASTVGVFLPRQETATTVTTQQVGQTRTGTQLTVVPTTTQNTTISDVVVDQSVIPYIRASVIDFTASGLKPNTRVYPFFDGVDVSVYCTPTGGSEGAALVSDNTGTLTGAFNVPNDDTLRFRTGSRVFFLTDVDNPNSLLATTSASATYVSAGTLDTDQATIESTQQYQVVQSTVSQTQTITQTNTNIQYLDPIAESFLISNPDGVFVSSIELFFTTKDLANTPIHLQMRTMTNGTPDQYILPFSDVWLNPSQVNVSTDGSVGTTFTFPSPVYLEGNGTEYCFVVLSNSNQYNLWVSILGDTDVLTGQRITEQPYAGVMFKSSNASTWTASQLEDIKFTINRCVFSTTETANILFDNAPVVTEALELDPFLTTTSSGTILVTHPNHGLRTGDKVTFSGVPGSENGIPAASLNTQFTITFYSFDQYHITLASGTATSTGSCGGDVVFATRNVRVDVMNIMATTIVNSSCSLNWGVKAKDATTGVLSTNFAAVAVKTNIQFASPQIILSPDNSGGTPSAIIQAQMTTTSDYISPVIDLTRVSFIAIANRVNNTDTGELNPQSGYALARYITKKVTLTDDATSLCVYLDAIRAADATIEVYVKAQTTDTQATTFDSLPYTLVPATDYPTADSSTFAAYTFQLQDMNPYTVFAVKIVMLAGSTTDVPQIMNFRAIAVGS